MHSARLVLVVLSSCVLSSSAWAGHHSWDLQEVFSDATTTVQFVELFCPAASEAGLNGFTVTSDSTGGTFTFNANVTGSTLNKSVLVATTAFAGLSGAPAPDYVLPDSFFDTAGDTLRYAGSADVWTFGAVPTNGTDSLDRSTGVGLNSPKNFNDQEGSVDASPSQPGVPSFAAWGLVVLAGIMMVGASGLLKSKRSQGASA